jgi:hypothetical protein
MLVVKTLFTGSKFVVNHNFNQTRQVDAMAAKPLPLSFLVRYVTAAPRREVLPHAQNVMIFLA